MPYYPISEYRTVRPTGMNRPQSTAIVARRFSLLMVLLFKNAKGKRRYKSTQSIISKSGGGRSKGRDTERQRRTTVWEGRKAKGVGKATHHEMIDD